MKIKREFVYSTFFGLVVGFFSLAFFYALAPTKDNPFQELLNNNQVITTLFVLLHCFIFVFYGGWGASDKQQGAYRIAGGIVYFLAYFLLLSLFYVIYINSCIGEYALFVLFVSYFIGRGIYRKHIAAAPVSPVPPAE